jgi:hypothetical protein
LICGILGLERKALTEIGIFREMRWSVKDLLAHVAAWDRWELRQMERILDGERPQGAAVDEYNAIVVAQWRDRSLEEVVAELRDARAAWVTWLRDLSDDVFFEGRPFDTWDWAFPNCLRVEWEHDAEHAAQIAAWREAYDLEGDVGPKVVLEAALDAAREELLAAADLVPHEVRASRRVCGVWRLKDLLGHVADWEQVGVEGLRSMARGRALEIQPVPDIDAWNADHFEVRRHQPWEEVWADLERIRAAFLRALASAREAQLCRRYAFPWGPEGTAYQWVVAFLDHDREHAQGLRQLL